MTISLEKGKIIKDSVTSEKASCCLISAAAFYLFGGVFVDKFKMVIPCLLGLEGPIAAELKTMEAENVAAQDGRVFFEGGADILARANLFSRYGERVQLYIGGFEALTFDQLFEGVKSLPWEQYIGKDDAFPVKGHALQSKLMSVPDCQSIVKKAIVERLKSRYHSAWFRETGAKKQVQFLIMKDKVSLMIDTSGVGLHKRGYRQNSVEAPIKETLAASMAYLSRVRTDGTIIDPFCGSGTLLIESALYALNVAPGIHRRFGAEKWAEIPEEVWRRERERARDLIRKGIDFQAYGYDIDDEAVELTKENARKAGVLSRIHVEKRDIKDFKRETEYGCVLCNPPYGERLLDIKTAQGIYKTMGEVFESARGWSYSIISPDHEFEKCFGRSADRRRKLYNGMISCQLYMYYK